MPRPGDGRGRAHRWGGIPRLYRAVTGAGEAEEPMLRELEDRNNIFPGLDYRVYR